ncbi:hypothetical protein RFI_13065 [Reticulomyxa filosa]|uniref:Uncharacterized protein n=1 Tax=Reticulomyxa filosa TaxID=46433 RepID=X6NDX4_RETFI|nr:hypothetical protein RFI_13065 [Reticulomyxa filosa]|eukprot:ETO24093.1 hypothetical protein RFI_13065 [Reticulomyxa filosa]
MAWEPVTRMLKQSPEDVLSLYRKKYCHSFDSTLPVIKGKQTSLTSTVWNWISWMGAHSLLSFHTHCAYELHFSEREIERLKNNLTFLNPYMIGIENGDSITTYEAIVCHITPLIWKLHGYNRKGISTQITTMASFRNHCSFTKNIGYFGNVLAPISTPVYTTVWFGCLPFAHSKLWRGVMFFTIMCICFFFFRFFKDSSQMLASKLRVTMNDYRQQSNKAIQNVDEYWSMVYALEHHWRGRVLPYNHHHYNNYLTLVSNEWLSNGIYDITFGCSFPAIKFVHRKDFNKFLVMPSSPCGPNSGGVDVFLYYPQYIISTLQTDTYQKLLHIASCHFSIFRNTHEQFYCKVALAKSYSAGVKVSKNCCHHLIQAINKL